MKNRFGVRGADVNRCESRTREQGSSKRVCRRKIKRDSPRDACNNARWVPLAEKKKRKKEKQAYSGLSRVSYSTLVRTDRRTILLEAHVGIAYDRVWRWWGGRKGHEGGRSASNARLRALQSNASHRWCRFRNDRCVIRHVRERARERERVARLRWIFSRTVCNRSASDCSFVGTGRLVGRSAARLSVCLSVCLSLVRRSRERTRNACREQKTAIPTRFKSISPILSTVLSLSLSPLFGWSQLLSPFLPFAVLIPLFLACLCSCPRSSRSRTLGLGRLRGRRARENISWPSGGSAEAFSQLAVMARPAAVGLGQLSGD